MLDLLAFTIFRSFALVCRAIGARASAAVGYALGLLYAALDSRRARTLANIASAVGHRRSTDVARRYYEHMGLLAVEYARLAALRPAEAVAGPWIRPTGIERMQAALASGHGAVCLTGHIGNWELTGYALASGVRLNSLYRPQASRQVDAVARSIRERSGMRVHEKGDAVLWSMRVLKARETVGILVDQDGSGWGVFVPFFGRLASTLPTAARLARRTGAPIIPVASHRLADRCTHVLRVGPPVEQAATGDAELDILITTRRCNEAIEALILERPGQWLWTTRRWRTVPSDAQVAAWHRAEGRLTART